MPFVLHKRCCEPLAEDRAASCCHSHSAKPQSLAWACIQVNWLLAFFAHSVCLERGIALASLLANLYAGLVGVLLFVFS